MLAAVSARLPTDDKWTLLYRIECPDRSPFFATNNGNSFAKTEIELTLDGRTYAIKLHDTAGHEEFEKVRQVFYKTVSTPVHDIRTLMIVRRMDKRGG